MVNFLCKSAKLLSFFRISRLHTEMTTDGTKDTTQEPQGIFSSNFN